MSLATVYTRLGCPYCQAAMEDLAKRGVEYREIVVPGNPEAEAELAELTKGESIVPVIVEDDRVQVGFGGG